MVTKVTLLSRLMANGWCNNFWHRKHSRSTGREKSKSGSKRGAVWQMWLPLLCRFLIRECLMSGAKWDSVRTRKSLFYYQGLWQKKDWGSNKQWKKIDKRGIERIGFSSILPDLIYDLTFNITSVGSYLTKICFSGTIKPYETDLAGLISVHRML